jgi:hypothetical protein
MATFIEDKSELNSTCDWIFYPWKSLGLPMRYNEFVKNGTIRNLTRPATLGTWIEDVTEASHNNLQFKDGVEWHPEIPMLHDNVDLSRLEGDLIIRGHGSGLQGSPIGLDCGYSRSPRTLARLLVSCGLPKKFLNKIIVWSCFSGVAHGFAGELAVALGNRGYQGCTIWGCLWAVERIEGAKFYCRPGVRESDLKDKYSRDDMSIATRQDMMVYAVGQRNS